MFWHLALNSKIAHAIKPSSQRTQKLFFHLKGGGAFRRLRTYMAEESARPFQDKGHVLVMTRFINDIAATGRQIRTADL
jgi:hypothetical protein